MTQTYASGKKLTLKAKLNPADTSLTADIDVGITAGRIYWKNDSQEEWIDFTGVSASGSNYSYTGLTRGLSQTADPATAGTGKTWVAGSQGVIVAMHDQLFDKQQDNVLPKAISFSGTTNPGITVANLTTAQREALTPANGMIVYDTTLGVHYQYIGGAWSTFATGATVNASKTVAGKVEAGTSAESKAGTNIGGTGALTFVSPSDIAANTQSSCFVYAEDAEVSDTYVVSYTPNITALTTGMTVSFKPNTTNTGACTINIDGLGATDIKLIDGTDPLDGDLTAGRTYDLKYNGTNFVLQQVPVRATSAEAIAGTNTINYITPNTGRLGLGRIEAGTTYTNLEANTERSTTNSSYTKLKTFTMGSAGEYTFSYELKVSINTGYGGIYLNGVIVNEQTTVLSTYSAKTYNLSVKKGDTVDLYAKTSGTGTVYVQNFNAKYDLVSGVTSGTVVTD